MSPTFENLDYLIIDEISYRFIEPARGDVIVFHYPLNPSIFYIKRVIGLPGEAVSISRGIVSVKSEGGVQEALDESYVTIEDATYTKNVALAEGEYFVMGDNRPNSSDSRTWGALPKKDIVGRALLRLLPLSKTSFFPGSAQYDGVASVAIPWPSTTP